MSKILTTNKIDLPLPDGVEEAEKDDPIHGKIKVLVGKRLKSITTNRVQPKTRLKGKAKKNYYPALTTTLLHEFPKTAKGKRDRDEHMEMEADKKRVADGVPPVIKKGRKK